LFCYGNNGRNVVLSYVSGRMKTLPSGTVELRVLPRSVGRSLLRLSKHTAGGTRLPTLILSHINAQNTSERKRKKRKTEGKMDWIERAREDKIQSEKHTEIGVNNK